MFASIVVYVGLVDDLWGQ